MNLTKFLSAAKVYFVPGLQRRRLLMAVLGVVTCAISVAFFKQAAFGTDPFQCMCNGIDLVSPIGYGTLYVIINAVLLVAVLLLDKHYIGIGTLINLFLYGYIVEFCEKLIYATFGDPSMALRIGYLAFAVVVLCIASALREMAIYGTLWNIPLGYEVRFPEAEHPFIGFILLGFMAATLQWCKNLSRRKDTREVETL
jgi:hypothetical protein